MGSQRESFFNEMEFKLNPRVDVAVWDEISITQETSVHRQCSNVVNVVSAALGDDAPREFPLYSSAQNESPGARWKALFLNMAPALSNCQWLDCISSGSINQEPTF